MTRDLFFSGGEVLLCCGCVFGHSLRGTSSGCDCVGGNGCLLEECGETIHVMGAFCEPLGRVRAGDAHPGNIARASGPSDETMSNVHTTYPL